MPGKRIRAGITAFLASTMVVAVAGASSATEPQAGATSAAPAKAWADPGSLERATTPSPKADAGSASSVNNGKDAASASPQQPSTKPEPAAAKEQHAAPVAAASAPKAGEAKHAQVRKLANAKPSRKAMARKPLPSHVAVGALPNKKDDYVAPATAPEFDPFTGYAQPVSAAY